MSFQPGDRVALHFPDGHESVKVNGLTGKITHRVMTLPSGELYNVWLETLFGNLAIGEQHLVAAE